MAQSVLKLNNGNFIPLVGLGTSQAFDNVVEEAVLSALNIGYRHIDTAFLYGNEAAIGRAVQTWVQAGKGTRQDVFIVSKLPPMGMTTKGVDKYLKKSLGKLGTGYIDLYLLHSPCAVEDTDEEITNAASTFKVKDLSVDVLSDFVAVWQALEKYVDAGLVKSLGVSNVNEEQIERLLRVARHPPVAVQVEAHIYFQQKSLREFCRHHGLVFCAYIPLGSPGRETFFKVRGMKFHDLLHDETVAKLAVKYGKSPAQIMLRFLTQLGMVVLPKSVSAERMRENFDITSFTVESDDLKELEALEKGDAGRVFNLLHLKDHPEYPFPK